MPGCAIQQIVRVASADGWFWWVLLMPTMPLLVPGRSRSLRLKLPALLALAGSKQSLPATEAPDAVVVDCAKQSSESGTEDATSWPEPGCPGSAQPEDQAALMGGEAPVTHSSPWADRLAPHAAFSDGSLARCRSGDSLRSLRRASSLDDMEAMKGDGDKRCHQRHASTGTGVHRGSSTGMPVPAAASVGRMRPQRLLAH